MADSNRKALESHFQFGENWSSFSQLLHDARIAHAVKSLEFLIPEELAGKSFLDIGCGSGLSTLAAARMQAAPILAVDLDPDSVATTKRVLENYAPGHAVQVQQTSVFALDPRIVGQFDVVHSWGVLHHTGAMWEAIDKAATLVTPGGLFVLAIYNKTPFCGFWKWEKRLYTQAPTWTRSAIFHLYRTTAWAYALVRLRNPWRISRNYVSDRGMDQDHDIRDWLGGYPYESATPREVDDFLRARGFRLEHSQSLKKRSGLMGTGCAEYAYRLMGTPS